MEIVELILHGFGNKMLNIVLSKYHEEKNNLNIH